MNRLRTRAVTRKNIIKRSYGRKKSLTAKKGFAGFDRKEIEYSRDKVKDMCSLINSVSGSLCENPLRGEKCFWCAKKFYVRNLNCPWIKCALCGFFRCSSCANKQCACRESGEKYNKDKHDFTTNRKYPLLMVSHVVKLNSLGMPRI